MVIAFVIRRVLLKGFWSRCINGRRGARWFEVLFNLPWDWFWLKKTLTYMLCPIWNHRSSFFQTKRITPQVHFTLYTSNQLSTFLFDVYFKMFMLLQFSMFGILWSLPLTCSYMYLSTNDPNLGLSSISTKLLQLWLLPVDIPCE